MLATAATCLYIIDQFDAPKVLLAAVAVLREFLAQYGASARVSTPPSIHSNRGSLMFVDDEAGEYTFRCKIPVHDTMKAMLVAQ